MIPAITFLLSIATLSLASPIVDVRAVTELDKAAFEEAHQRDDGATRAFSAVEIKTSDGQCLFVDELSGDFRANLTPIQVAACDGSQGQAWDIITSGKHNNKEGMMLVVNTLTQACLDINKGRKGREVTAFSCGGRAAGEGEVTLDQLWKVASAGTFSFKNAREEGGCLGLVGNVLAPAGCIEGAAAQTFTIGEGKTSDASPNPPVQEPAVSSTAPILTNTTQIEQPASSTACISTTLLTVTRSPASTETPATSEILSGSASTTNTIVSPTNPPATSEAVPTSSSTTDSIVPPTNPPAQVANPTTPVPVSRAGGVLNPTAAAEANIRDDTATRAFSGVTVRSSTGQCLFIDPTAGDFRQNLIPVQAQECNGSDNEKFDFITSGKHNNKQGTALIVSSLMQGCVNFDARRAVGDTVITFSCGGRADGEGGTTGDQTFGFDGGNELVLRTKNADGSDSASCLVLQGGKLVSTGCTRAADQVFRIV